jgi:hypothetical protein
MNPSEKNKDLSLLDQDLLFVGNRLAAEIRLSSISLNA